MGDRRLLAAATVPVWPPREGYALRVACLLAELARDWQITLLAPPGDDPGGPARAGIAEFVPVSMPGRWTLMPSQYDTGPLRAAAGDAVRRLRPEVALLWSGAEFLGFDPTSFPASVADRVDCRALIYWRYACRAPGLVDRLRHGRSALEFARYERRIVREVHATVVVGDDDARALRRLSRRGVIEVIPNGVLVEGRPDPAGEAIRPEVIFSGVMGYGPNIDAVVFFADKVWPSVLAAVPDATFVIAGRAPTTAVRALGDRSGIQIRADVPDMRRTLAGAWIAVAPMTSGAGIKNKVLEAWAVGKPVVMTSLASNGLHLDETARGLVTDDPAKMATLVAGLLRNAPDRHRLGAAAQALARQRHGWPDAAQQINRLLEGAVRAGRR